MFLWLQVPYYIPVTVQELVKKEFCIQSKVFNIYYIFQYVFFVLFVPPCKQHLQSINVRAEPPAS